MSEQIKPCDLPCPKCGSADILRRFWPKGSLRQAKEYNKPMSKHVAVLCWNARAIRDHIEHHCRCCHYEWSTPPIKAPKKVAQTA